MPYFRFASLTALVVAIFASAQSQPSDQTTIMASAQKAAVRALNFRQGEVSSLTRVHGDFTPEGWKDFYETHGGVPRSERGTHFQFELRAFKGPGIPR